LDNYENEFQDAILRSQKHGLAIPRVHRTATRYLTLHAQQRFADAVHEAIGSPGLEEIVSQCMTIHHRLQRPLERLLHCPTYYTIGWVSYSSGNHFKFDDSLIAEKLKYGHIPGSSISIHVWLTLPSMEIIDLSLSTTMGYVLKNERMLGGVIATHSNELTGGMAYKPMLVGDDFLRKSGVLFEF
jgi:hypothetical protein